MIYLFSTSTEDASLITPDPCTMPVRAKDLSALVHLAGDIKTRAANLFHNVKLRRVSHTVKTLRLLMRDVTKMRFELEDNSQFVKDLAYALYQSQSGATEIVPQKDGTIFIGGSFSVDQLRIHLMVNYPVDTLLLEVAEPERPRCKICGLEDGACICAHLRDRK